MIQIEHLRLRSITATKKYGVDIPLSSGLNVIVANNTSGKSTTLMAIVFGLGMERSIGPKLNVPLPYAMRDRIETTPDSGVYEAVIESYVQIGLSNGQGEQMTIRRDIAGAVDQKLIRTWNCSIEQVDTDGGVQSDFFLFDAGAATNEDGFHRKLTQFIGWDLPIVPKFDGHEVPLYLETLFPMFFVEQKRGWATVQGPFPTYLGIQDLPRRVMEFTLDLDAGKIRRHRSELLKEKIRLQARYHTMSKELTEDKSSLVRIEGLPRNPTSEFGQDGTISLFVYHNDQWQNLENVALEIREKVSEFDSTEYSMVDAAAEELQSKLKETEERYFELNSQIQVLRQDGRLAISEKKAFQDRVKALEIDLVRNRDTLKLQKLGSTLGSASADQHCPTCQQHVANELLPPASRKAMGIEENIVFIKSQLDLHRSMLGAVTDTIDVINVHFQSLSEELQENRSKIRSLKQDLVRPTKGRVRSKLEEIVRLEARFKYWQALQEKLDGSVEGLREVCRKWALNQESLRKLGKGELTEGDQSKVDSLQAKTRNFLGSFGFRSFPSQDITISSDDFRPQVTTLEDTGEVVIKDIGFEASASDGIRLKWAYYLSLLDLSKSQSSNNIGFAAFDEPGQQQMKELDLAKFLGACSNVAGQKRQVIVTTSEVLERVESALKTHDAKIHPFDGYILKPLT